MKRLNDSHWKAILLIVDGKLTMSEIADEIGKSRSALYKWLDDPVFRAALDERIKERGAACKRRISALAKNALDRAEKILDSSDDDRAAASVIADVLDRAGYPKVKSGKTGDGKDKKRTGIVLLPDIQKEGEDNG